MTGDAACRGIRDHDADGSIGMFAAEQHEPYARPPLSKGSGPARKRAPSSAGRPSSASTSTLGRRIVELDLDARTRHGRRRRRRTRTRRSCSRPAARRGSCRRTTADVIYYRTLDDYRRLRDLAGDGVRAAVIGGGFIGSEIAAALAVERMRRDHRLPRPRDRRTAVPRRPRVASSTTTTARRASPFSRSELVEGSLQAR